MGEAARLLTPAAAGAELGISRQRVNKLVEKWPEAKVDGKIDIDRLRTLRDANADPLRQMAYQHSARTRAAEAEPTRVAVPTVQKAAPASTGDQAEGEPEQGELALMSFTEAKTARERSNARLAELKVQEQEGLLISRREVESLNFAIARRIRDRILGFPTKLQQFLPADAMPTLIDECKRLIKELAEDAERVADGNE
jgi:phage terminase Nu1 subunit (DNA packaging protein)